MTGHVSFLICCFAKRLSSYSCFAKLALAKDDRRYITIVIGQFTLFSSMSLCTIMLSKDDAYTNWAMTTHNRYFSLFCFFCKMVIVLLIFCKHVIWQVPYRTTNWKNTTWPKSFFMCCKMQFLNVACIYHCTTMILE